MAVLKLEPTAVPKFTGVSSILEQAGLAQERAFDAAGDLLTSYQTGQTEKADREVSAEINQLNSREDIEAYFAKNGVAGRPISANMREILGNLLPNQADLNRTRAGNAALLGKEARTQFGFDEANAAVASDRALKIVSAAAERERRDPISAAVTNESTSSPVSSDGQPSVKSPGSSAIEAAAIAPGGGADTVAAVLPKYTPSTPIETSFMNAVAVEMKNPHALAVIAAYGQHESGFIAKNADGTWPDGKNRAGGILSWNGVRLTNMQNFTAGDTSPEAQAAFFLQEDEELIEKLEASTSLEEANSIMADAWRFKGHENRGAGSEFAARLATAKGIFGDGPVAQATQPAGAPISEEPLDPIAAAIAPPPAGPTGPGGFTLRTDLGNVSSAFATALPTLTDPEKTSSGILPTGPTGPAPAPGASVAPPAAAAAGAAATALLAPATPPAAPVSPAAATIAASTPPPVQKAATPHMDAFRKAVLADDTIGAKQASKLFAEMDEFEEQGIAKRKLKQAKKVRGQIADMVLVNSLDPENHDRRAVVLDTVKLAMEAGLTSEEVLQAAGFASQAADGDFKDLVIPKTTNNVMVDAVIAVAIKAGKAEYTSTPQHRIFALASDMASAETPTKGIIANLELDTDDQAPSEYPFGLGWWGEAGKDENILTRYVADIASEAKVSPSVAAAAMIENFVRDPLGINTVANRFPKDKILEFLKNNMGADAVARYSSLVLVAKSREQEFVTEREELGIAQDTFQKMQPGPEKDALGRAIATQRDTLLSGNTSDEGKLALSDYVGKDGMDVSATLLRALETGDTERQRAGINNIRKTIKNDKKLSPSQRSLLLAALNQ